LVVSNAVFLAFRVIMSNRGGSRAGYLLFAQVVSNRF
jgi:hypothetical protein